MAYELTVETTVCDTEMTKLMTSLVTRNIITFASSNVQVPEFEILICALNVRHFWVVSCTYCKPPSQLLILAGSLDTRSTVDQTDPPGTPECTGPPGGKRADRWRVGPDRYYAANGIVAHGRQSWSVANSHCVHDMNSQLAIPYSLDDAHFMKHMEHIHGGVAWVGKLFPSE